MGLRVNAERRATKEKASGVKGFFGMLEIGWWPGLVIVILAAAFIWMILTCVERILILLDRKWRRKGSSNKGGYTY